MQGVPGTDGVDGAPGAIGGTGGTGPQGTPGAPAILAAQPVSAYTGLALTVGTYVDVPGASLAITVPPNTTALVVARWTGVINPYDTAYQFPDLRFVVDGATTMQPTAQDGEYFGPITFERSLPGVAAGTHTITLQAAVKPGGATAQTVNLGDSELVVEGAPG